MFDKPTKFAAGETYSSISPQRNEEQPSVLILRHSCINSKLKFDSSKNIYKFMLPFL